MDKIYELPYLRKSTDTEDRQVQSIADQLKALTPLADGNILKIFQESKSAKAPGRPVFNEMVAFINSRQDIKGILCWNLSRLARNPIDISTIQWMLQEGVILEVKTPTHTYTEADCDLLMGLEGGLATRYIRDLAKDVKRGLNSKVEKGMRPGLAPLGYQNNLLRVKGEKDVIPHSVYFPLMKKVFSLALTGRYSIVDLAEKANGLKIQSSRGKEVSKQSMYKILRNPFYCGKFVFNNVLYAGSHKPMISEAQFDRIQNIFDNPSKPRAKAPYALTGVFNCPTCHSMITYEKRTKHYKNGTVQEFGYYRCTKKRGPCNEKYLPAAELEKQVVEILDKIKLSRVYVEWAIKWLSRANEEKEQLRQAHFESLNNAYNGVEQRLTNLFDMKISPKNIDGAMITDEDYIAQKQKLVLERKRISKQLEELESTVDEFYDLSEKAFDFASRAKDMFINAKTIDVKKKILLTVGSNLTISGQKVEIQLQKPFKLIEEALIKLKSRKIPLELEKGLLEDSNRFNSYESKIMSG